MDDFKETKKELKTLYNIKKTSLIVGILFFILLVMTFISGQNYTAEILAKVEQYSENSEFFRSTANEFNGQPGIIYTIEARPYRPDYAEAWHHGAMLAKPGDYIEFRLKIKDDAITDIPTLPDGMSSIEFMGSTLGFERVAGFSVEATNLDEVQISTFYKGDDYFSDDSIYFWIGVYEVGNNLADSPSMDIVVEGESVTSFLVGTPHGGFNGTLIAVLIGSIIIFSIIIPIATTLAARRISPLF